MTAAFRKTSPSFFATRSTELDAEVTETQAAQIELDKTAEDFKRLHQDRGDLVGQWEAAVQAMQKRDESIQHAREEFLTTKRQLKEKQQVLTERDGFLQTEQKNNQEVELKISAHERSIAKKREVLTFATAQLSELADQVEVVRGTLSKAAAEMAQRKGHGQALSSQVDERKRRFDVAKKKLAQAEKELERSYAHMGDLEASAKQMEDIYKDEEQRVKACDKDQTGAHQSIDVSPLRLILVPCTPSRPILLRSSQGEDVHRGSKALRDAPAGGYCSRRDLGCAAGGTQRQPAHQTP